MILSIIVLLDVLAALSALLGLADFFDTAEVLSKIVLKENKNEKSLDVKEEVVSNREFPRRSNNNGINRELAKTINGKDGSGEIETDSFFGGGQSDLIYLMNTTDGELMDPRGEVATLTIKHKIWINL